MLTIKEIADQLQMPATTLRGYRDEFDDYLPHEGEGRFRRYSDECIQLLSQIKAMKQNGLSKEEIESQLGTRTIAATTTTTKQEAQERYLAVLSQSSKRLSDQLEEIQQTQQATLEALRELQQAKENKWWKFWE